jgi:hypothetical protein
MGKREFKARRPRQITDATNASPIVITSDAHSLKTGMSVVIKGVQGNTAANGTFSVTMLDANRFSLDGSHGNGDFVASPDATFQGKVEPAAFEIPVRQAKTAVSKGGGAVLIGDAAATPHPSTSLGLNTGSDEVGAVSRLLDTLTPENEDEALSAYDWEVHQRTNVMVRRALTMMVGKSADRCNRVIRNYNTDTRTEGKKAPDKKVSERLQEVRDQVINPVGGKVTANLDDRDLCSAAISFLRDLEGKLLRACDLADNNDAANALVLLSQVGLPPRFA